ncbi:MAG: hypothetical protein IPH43_03615 [Xanthomonadales bacterium]|nr:hypothetical protein [Xanthomonadales bacterium]
MTVDAGSAEWISAIVEEEMNPGDDELAVTLRHAQRARFMPSCASVRHRNMHRPLGQSGNQLRRLPTAGQGLMVTSSRPQILTLDSIEDWNRIFARIAMAAI